MKKRTQSSLGIIVAGSLILIGFTTWVFKQSDRINPMPASEPARPSVNVGPQVRKAENETAHEIGRVTTKTELLFSRISQPPVDTPPQQKSSLLQGWAETATLVDKTGHPLLKATAPIYSVAPSPSGDLAILARGGGVHQVYRLSPFELICELPLSPNLPRATTFDVWQWINDRKLLGVSATAKSAAELERFTSAERESESVWRESTVLYCFDLEERSLTLADVGTADLPRSFTVVAIHFGGLVNVEWDDNENAKTAWIVANGKH